ncbi:hypothetical protein GDO81_007698 [Engystomops pustulosus]|uniref:Uncharacterized protein n=2 Tax=Engystomops pustulosus TaxID=76066 RepID=A0AAV7CA25_ENGPU|nr:hypothetical protein GDO81_007698 [Engystomops pustulosus]
MVTGDNLQTAVTVGKKSGMIPSTSNIIMLEACEPEKNVPASVTWKTLPASEENMSFIMAKKTHIDTDKAWMNNPTTLGNYHFAMNGKS